jgi:hypothetical protein
MMIIRIMAVMVTVLILVLKNNRKAQQFVFVILMWAI